MSDMDKSLSSMRTLGGHSGHHSAHDSFGDAATMRRIESADRLTVGSIVLKRYRILGELGQGGMGIVYRCFDEVGGIEVALKALPPEVSHDSDEMEDVRNNFRLVERLHHPNIAGIKTLERDQVSGDYYLIMECVEGMDLRQWARKRRRESRALTVDEVLTVAHYIAAALDYAHEQNVIHRDIKPGNVRVTFDGEVKVLDFGLAAQIQTSMHRVSRVYNGGTSGTGPYMAPEQWRGLRQDPRTDQYSLAATVYELLSGVPPFQSHDIAVLREVALNESPQPLPDVPEYINAALMRALAKEPGERFTRCSKFVKALYGSLSTAPVKDRAEPDRQSSESTVTPSRLKKLPLSLVLVAAMAYVGYEAYVLIRPQEARQISDSNQQPYFPPDEPEVEREKTGLLDQITNSEKKNDGLISKLLPSQNMTLPDLEPDGRVIKIDFTVLRGEAARARERQIKFAETSRLPVSVISQKSRIHFCLLPPGKFLMGSPEDETGRAINEKQRTINISQPYYVSSREVTVGDWSRVMEGRPISAKVMEALYPKCNLSWVEACNFCDKLSDLEGVPRGTYSLLTEAQWEYACRAGAETSFVSGNIMTLAGRSSRLDLVGWYDFNSKKTTSPGGHLHPNAWGLFDMHGNAMEWCLDKVALFSDGQIVETEHWDNAQDPIGTSGAYRIARGGSYYHSAEHCRAAKRTAYLSEFKGVFLGFRICRNIELWEQEQVKRGKL